VKIKLMTIGSVRAIEIRDGATVAELLCMLNHYDDVDIAVRIGEKRAFPDTVLSDGDQVLVAFPIRGSAPLPPGHVREGIAQLRNFTAGATDLIVVDPYFVKPRRGIGTAGHVRLIVDTTDLPSGHLNRLRVVNSWWHHDSDVVSSLSAECARYGCELGYKQTNDIHDRVWVKDMREAMAVGTSLNSVGSRLAFALKLPDDDLQYLLELLHRRNLV
jgi:hypothetical protein